MKQVAARWLAGILVLGLSLSACADVRTPTEPGRTLAEPGHAAFSSTGGPDLHVLARFNGPKSITIAWAKKWIGPAGGRLDFQGFAIEVPPGAVDKTTQFSIRLPVDPKASERVVAEFGPHQTFSAPVIIELPYAGTSAYGGDATVGWWNQDVSAWEDVGGSVTPDGLRLRTSTDHFSTYGTVEGRGDTVILSGG